MTGWKSFSFVTSVFFAVSLKSFAAEQCDAALKIRDVEITKLDKAEALDMLFSLDETSFQEVKKSKKLDIAIPDVGTLASKSNSNEQFQSSLREHYQLSETKNFNFKNQKSVFSSNALEAYTECLKTKQGGIAAYLESTADSTASIRLTYKQPLGYETNENPTIIVAGTNVKFTPLTEATTKKLGEGSKGSIDTILDLTKDPSQTGLVEIQAGLLKKITLVLSPRPKITRKERVFDKDPWHEDFTLNYHSQLLEQEICLSSPSDKKFFDTDRLDFKVSIAEANQGGSFGVFADRSKWGAVTNQRVCLKIEFVPQAAPVNNAYRDYGVKLDIKAFLYALVERNG
jgi:hypothetical protein